MQGTFQITNIPYLPHFIDMNKCWYKTNTLFAIQNNHKGVIGLQYNLADNTTKDYYLPTGMYPVSHTSLVNQGCIVLVKVDPWNHLLSYVFHQRFNVCGCHTNIYRIHHSTTPCAANKSLHHNNMITYLGLWLYCLV